MSSAQSFPLLAKTFTGLESVLAAELTDLGAREVATGRRMVSFSGDQELLYRANICCRTAVRILKPIATFELDSVTTNTAAADPAKALYAGLQEIDWAPHLDAGGTLAIDPVVHNSPITNSMYASQVAKDAICDWFRDRYGERPNVEKQRPDLRINLHIDARKVTVYLDASDQSLHKRGYRRETNEAPLNEVLAAGILRLVGWDGSAPLVDFMCGSGTLPIEAALMAGNIAPGILRQQFGYMRWPDFDSALHARLLDAAQQARRAPGPLMIHGSDIDSQVIAAARDNAARAGVAKAIQFAESNFEAVVPPGPAGTIVFNPPYDERQKVDRIAAFYRRLGDVLKRRWSGYTAWMFTGNLVAAKQVGLRTAARIPLNNGPIECRLLKFPLFSAAPAQDIAASPLQDSGEALEPAEKVAEVNETVDDSPNDSDNDSPAAAEHAVTGRRGGQTSAAATAEAFRNRLRRMGKHWARWARRQGISCYRVYDREIPVVSLSVDRYEDQLYIVEHARPHARTPIEQRIWFDDLARAAGEELGVPGERIHAHRRDPSARPSRARDQLQVVEAGHKFGVSLSNRTDVGLPLDERELRAWIVAESSGKRFLNLFGRGGAASVFAAAGGAASTVTIETSSGLAGWSRDNLALNGFAEPEHVVIEADPLQFLERLTRQQAPPFDLVLAAPPGGYHRRDSQQGWDARPELLHLLGTHMPLVSPGGKIYFVTTARRFKLEPDDLPGTTIRELTRRSVPPDFKSKPPHRCWSIVRAEPPASD